MNPEEHTPEEIADQIPEDKVRELRQLLEEKEFEIYGRIGG